MRTKSVQIAVYRTFYTQNHTKTCHIYSVISGLIISQPHAAGHRLLRSQTNTAHKKAAILYSYKTKKWRKQFHFAAERSLLCGRLNMYNLRIVNIAYFSVGKKDAVLVSFFCLSDWTKKIQPPPVVKYLSWLSEIFYPKFKKIKADQWIFSEVSRMYR